MNPWRIGVIGCALEIQSRRQALFDPLGQDLRRTSYLGHDTIIATTILRPGDQNSSQTDAAFLSLRAAELPSSR